MDKALLRKIYLQKRKALTHSQQLKLDDLLLIQFQRLAFENIQYLMSYWPLELHHEPNTHLFTKYLQYMWPAIQIAYPKSDFTQHRMEATLTDEDTDFQVNNWQIMEPVNGIVLAPEKLDLVFVPMVICDSTGHRVGYGKGFYDRFLARCRPDVLKVGWSYFPPVESITGVHEFDLPLDYCITPDQIYAF